MLARVTALLAAASFRAAKSEVAACYILVAIS
jgi:hypothetical protein